MEADQEKSLFLVRYTGHVSVPEAEEGVTQARAVIAQLETGFRLLADLTDLLSMDVGCAPMIERVMDLCQEAGVSEVVRVIPDPRRDIGLQIMSRFHYASNVRIVTCNTMAEAIEVLAAGEV
jgi:hypothetical protein